jgi:hypothetical protein
MCTGVTDEAASMREAALRRDLAEAQAMLSLFARQVAVSAEHHRRAVAEAERLRADNDRLRERNEALARAAKRQAAPFSRRPGGTGEAQPKRAHKRAGRKPGAA